MSLTQALATAKQEFIAHTPLEIQTKMFRQIKEQQESGITYGRQEGQRAKDFALKNALGETVNLYDELSKGPVVLTFYRGGWCPFCNTQLKSYQKLLPDIVALGGQLIAISPQSPDNTLSHQEKEELSFQVLSDTNGLVAAFYNILYDVPDYIQNIMKQAGMDLAEYNAMDRWVLPIPSTFMIDESGIIRSAYVNPDFMQRFDPDDILQELRKL